MKIPTVTTSLVSTVIVALTLLVGQVYFHSGFPYTHDGENHLARFANYKIAVREGQIPPRLAPNLINRYGYPVFNYNYPLANMLSLPFSFLKLNYELTFKILALSSLALGLTGAYFWLAALKFPPTSRLVGVVALATSPYLINTIYYRGNIGELMAISLLPWMMYVIDQLKAESERPQLKSDLSLNWLLLVGLITAFCLAHNLTAIFGLPLILFYAAIRLKTNLGAWKQYAALLLAAILLSLWFWLPALAEKQLVVLAAGELANSFASYFPTLGQLVFASFSFGFAYPGSIDSLSFWLGAGQLAGLIGFTLLAFKKNSFFSWLVGLCWLLVIFQLAVTEPVWSAIPFARYLQFPWRLSLFFSVFSLPLVAALFHQGGKTIKLGLLVLLGLQLLSLSRLQAVDYFHKTNVDYDAFSQSTSTQNENTATTFTYATISDWQPSPSFLAGEGTIAVDYWKGSDRQYHLTVEQAAIMTEPTMNFLGWQTTVNGELVDYLDSDVIQGRLAYRLEPGEYAVRSRFTQQTWARRVGNTTSLVTLAGLVMLMAYRYVKKFV